MALDTQQVELIGRNLLMAQLLADGIEVALPQRDRGVDLIAYLDDDVSGTFIGRPIQLKAASSEAFVVDRKYERFHQLLMVYVWHCAVPSTAVTFCLTHEECVAVATTMGWTSTASWKRGAYSTSAPSARLAELLLPYRMDSGSWRARLLA